MRELTEQLKSSSMPESEIEEAVWLLVLFCTVVTMNTLTLVCKIIYSQAEHKQSSNMEEPLQSCSEGILPLFCSYTNHPSMILTALTGTDPNSFRSAYS